MNKKITSISILSFPFKYIASSQSDIYRIFIGCVNGTIMGEKGFTGCSLPIK